MSKCEAILKEVALVCPNDAAKTSPGTCGCGVADIDTDNDGTLDCVDGCPNDPLKTSAGACGCGVADTDADGDLDGYLATTGTAPPPTAKFRVKMVPRAGDGKEVPVVVPEGLRRQDRGLSPDLPRGLLARLLFGA